MVLYFWFMEYFIYLRVLGADRFVEVVYDASKLSYTFGVVPTMSKELGATVETARWLKQAHPGEVLGVQVVGKVNGKVLEVWELHGKG